MWPSWSSVNPRISCSLMRPTPMAETWVFDMWISCHWRDCVAYIDFGRCVQMLHFFDWNAILAGIIWSAVRDEQEFGWNVQIWEGRLLTNDTSLTITVDRAESIFLNKARWVLFVPSKCAKIMSLKIGTCPYSLSYANWTHPGACDVLSLPNLFLAMLLSL